MPGIAGMAQTESSPCKWEKVSRKIYFRDWKTDELLISTTSGKNGFYFVLLMSGFYRVTVDDKSKEYCRLTDEYGRCALAKVDPVKSKFDIEINKASW